MNEPRKIARRVSGYSHPERPGDLPPGSIETWIQGETLDGAAAFRVDHGAGLGHAHLSLLVEFTDGARVHEYIDVATLTEAWVNAIVDDHTTVEAVEPCDPGAHSWVRVGSVDQYCEACGVELRHTDEADEEPEPPTVEHTDRMQDADIADREAGL